jgi:hypothetical protein
MTEPETTESETERRRRRVPLLVLFLVGGLGLALVATAIILYVARGDDTSSDENLQTVTYEAPTAPADDPFTEAADIEGDQTVRFTPAVNANGEPYGGSGSNHVCDREALLEFLLRSPDRMRAWADVLGIDPSKTAVSRYVRSLTPVTLTVDTRVTNHDYVNGRAVPFQSILAAGTAVLVDKYGRPVVRCKCGNPLREPIYYPKANCKKCPPKYKPPPPCYWTPYPPWWPYPPEYLPPKWRDPYPPDYPKPKYGVDKKGRPCYLPYPKPPPVDYPPRWKPKAKPGPAYSPGPTYQPGPTYSPPPYDGGHTTPPDHDDGGYVPPPDHDDDGYIPPPDHDEDEEH